jgi:cyanate lyase
MNIFTETKQMRGVTYLDISLATGIDQSYIRNMFSGARSFRQAHLVQISQFLGLDPEQAIDAWTEMEKKRANISLERDREHLRRMFAEARKKPEAE